MIQLEQPEIGLGLLVESRLLGSEELFKNEEVREHRREELAIVFAVGICYRFSVQPDLSGPRAEKTRQQLRQGRLPAPIAPGDEDQLAGSDGETDRAKNEPAIFVFHVVREDELVEFEAFPR